MKILFSIVIPLYNKEEYVLETVLSVLNQTYKNFELIVVNDGSTDRSIEKINEINDRRMVIYNKINEGEGPARNYGIKISKGDWVAFLDADDVWHDNHLMFLNKIITQNSRADIVSNKITFIKGNINNKKYHRIEKINYLKEVIKNPGIIHSSSVAIKRTVFKKIGYFLNHKTGVDTEYWMRAHLENMEFYVSSQYTVFYRSDTGGAMDQDYKKLKKGSLSFIDLKNISLSVNTLLDYHNRHNIKLNKNNLAKKYINNFIINRIKTAIIFEDSYSLMELSNMLIISSSSLVIILKILNYLPQKAIKIIFLMYKLFRIIKNKTASHKK